MNDRFAAQMRQHLLETADVRPADGQLASVIDGVAAARQRHSLTARLMSSLGRIGPRPSAAIRYGLLAVGFALATVVGASMAGGAKQASTVFEGTWITIDPADGSGMTLVVGPGQTPDVYFEDGYASGLACRDDVVKRFTARGTGTISGDHLVATFPNGGGCGLTTVEVRGFYDYDQGDGTLSDQDGVVWTQALGEQALPAPETPAPTTSAEAETPRSSDRPGDPTFVSAVNGISIDYPEGWQTTSATEPWKGGELDFDTPGADVIFDPTFGGDLYIVVASESYGGGSADQWWIDSGEWLCPDGVDGAGGSWGIDGANTNYVRCGSTKTFLLMTDTRGYAIRLVVPSDEPALAEFHDQDWLLGVVETADLRPEDAVDPSVAAPDSSPTPDPTVAEVTPTPDPNCIQFDAPGMYTAPVGALSLTVAMPGTAAEPWHGHADSFDVMRVSCTNMRGGQGWIDAGEVTQVATTACAGGPVAVHTTAEAIAALSVAKGIEVVEQTDVTVGGYSGARFDIWVPEVANPCPDQQIPLLDGGNPVDVGVGYRIYLIDVDGTTLALKLFAYPEWDTTLRGDVDGIIASLRIDRQP